MKNIFSKISSFAKSISNVAREKIEHAGSSVRNKVGAILTGSMIAVSAPALAENTWIQVDTPGMGPREFAVKHFNTPNWELLKDKEGNFVVNPNTDFKFGREYTIGRRDDVVKNENKKTAPITSKNEKKVEKTEKKENPFFSKETYTLSYSELQSKFNITAYKEAVASFESNGKYTARNDKKGKEGGVEISKWAFGKYQFTVGTLKGYGIHLTKNGVLDEKRVQYFLGNKELQEDLMNKYIGESLNMISGNSQIHKIIIDGIVSIPALLAKGHIAGHGSIDKVWGGKDWLGTPVRVYAKKIEKTYHSMVAANDENPMPHTISLSESETITPIVVAENMTQVEKVSLPQRQSANDSFYSKKISDLRKVSDITRTVTTAETKVNNIIGGLSNTRLKQSIERKMTPYDSKIDGLYANLYHYDMLSLDLEKQSRNAIGSQREKLIADMYAARKLTNDLRTLISKLEGEYLKKVA